MNLPADTILGTDPVHSADTDLGGGYRLRPIGLEAYREIYAAREAAVFASTSYDWPERTGPQPPQPTPARYSWAVLHGEGEREQVVGWHHARQWNDSTVYMVNSGLLPQHRGRGVYTRMLPPLLAFFAAQGYTLVRSHHHATNNAVLIPKLRAGFYLQGLEMDEHGLMAVLIYSFDDTYRQALHVRSGLEYPEPETARRLGLSTFTEESHAR